MQALKNDAAKELSARMLRAYYRLPYRSVLAEGSGYHSSRIVDEPLSASNAAIDLALVASLSLPATAALALAVPFLLLLAARYRGAIKRHAGDEKENESRLRALVMKLLVVMHGDDDLKKRTGSSSSKPFAEGLDIAPAPCPGPGLPGVR